MSDHFKELRDKLEKEYYTKWFHEGWVCADFRNGFDSAIKILSKAAGEFDEKSCAEFEKGFHKNLYSGINPTSLSNGDFAMATREGHLLGIRIGARWQFERDAARIGLAETEKQTAIYFADTLKFKLTASEARVKALESSRDELYEDLCKERTTAINPSDSEIAGDREPSK